MSVELPPAPTQNEGESLADFQIRHLIWWREGDLKQRVACHNMKAEWMASVVTQLSPTLTRIADAWDAFDVRLGELAAAMGQGEGDGVSELTLLEAMRISRGAPGG